MKVLIQMDQGGLQWWPTVEPEQNDTIDEHPHHKYWLDKRKVEIEIPDALYGHYKQVSAQYYELQNIFEHLYRKQQGLQPHLECPPELR